MGMTACAIFLAPGPRGQLGAVEHLRQTKLVGKPVVKGRQLEVWGQLRYYLLSLLDRGIARRSAK